MSFFGVTDDGSLRFAESQVKEIKLTPFKWSRRSTLSDNYFLRFRNTNGVSSLSMMALRSIVKYRHLLTAEALEQVEWIPLGQKIWKRITAMKGVTVAVWKEFVTVYGSDEDAKLELAILVAPTILPVHLLTSTNSLLQSPDFRFVTLVNLLNQAMDLSRWMSLCDMTNLRALLVDTGQLPTRFDERVAKGWATHAKENSAFSHLHSFSLCSYNGRRTMMTGQAMKLLLDLPNLEVVGLRGVAAVDARELDNEPEFGWKRARSYKYPEQDSRSYASQVDLHDFIWTNWPSPRLDNSISKLVVRVGDAGDTNVFRLSYNTFSSFTYMIRDTAAAEKTEEVSQTSLPPKTQQSQSKMRRGAQKDTGDLLSSLGGYG